MLLRGCVRRLGGLRSLERPLLQQTSKLSRLLCSTTQPASRKRGGSGSSSRGGPVGALDFDFEVKKAMDSIYKAIDPMLLLNETYKLTKNATSEEILLDTGAKGFYIFRIDRRMERLFVQTPISGTHQYEFNVEDKTWLDVHDKHDMRGLITRDLLRHSRGCPKF